MAVRTLLAPLLVLLVSTGINAGDVAGQESENQDTPGETRRVISPAGDVSIAYRAVGSEDPTVLFVHGWMCDRTYWREQVGYFSGDYRVVTVDLAGHGESGRDRDDWSVESFAQDVVAVANALESEQLVLAGHSSGGIIVAEAARRLRGRVASIVGVDTFFDSWAENVQEYLADLIADLDEDFQPTAIEWGTNTMFLPGADSSFARRIARDMASGPEEVGVRSLQGTARWLDANYPEILASFEIPVGIIQSELYSDLLSTVDSVGTARGPLRIRLIPGTGHFLMRERPEAFNRALEAMVVDWTTGSSGSG